MEHTLQIWRCSFSFKTIKLFRVSMGLLGSRLSERNPVVICQFGDFEPPEYVAPTSARAHTRTQRYAGLLRTPQRGAREKPNGWKSKKCRKETSIYYTVKCMLQILSVTIQVAISKVSRFQLQLGDRLAAGRSRGGGDGRPTPMASGWSLGTG